MCYNSIMKKFFLWTLFIVFILLVLIFFMSLIYQLDNSKKVFDTYKNQLPNYNDCPVLVFNSVDFFKYIIRGKPQGTNEYLDELEVYLVKGSADFGFDFSKITFDKQKTNIINRTLVINYYYDTYFPIFADIKINAEDVTLVKNILPQKISIEDANKTAKVVATVTGGISGGTAALLGGKIGGMFALSPIKKVVSGLVPGIITTSVVAASSYVMTKNFLQEYSLPVSTVADREVLIENSKTLIALELLAQNNIHSAIDQITLNQWEQLIIDKYKSQIEAALQNFFNNYGWKTVTINFFRSVE